MSSELIEILLWFLLIVLLLVLLNALQNAGVLDFVKVVHTKMPPMLVATITAPAMQPEVTPEMTQVAMMAAKRGVEEELSETEGHPARGYFYGEFPNSLSKRPTLHNHLASTSNSHHGVVLEVGTARATERARRDWQQRLSITTDNSVTEQLHVNVRIVPEGQAILMVAPGRTGVIARAVTRWRLLKRLERRFRTSEEGSDGRRSRRRSPIADNVTVSVLLSPHKQELAFALHTAVNDGTGNIRPFISHEGTEGSVSTTPGRGTAGASASR